jgi:uncharacterized membrane protein YqaE (UPF0057 family)
MTFFFVMLVHSQPSPYFEAKLLYMKHILLLFAFLVMGATQSHAVVNAKWQKMAQTDESLQNLPPELLEMGLATFLSITPKEYKVRTGDRLGLMNSIKLKFAQKRVKKALMASDDGISEGVYILLAILGLAWIAMGVKDDWKGDTWVINLILSFLCWLPGLIHALVKKSDYF